MKEGEEGMLTFEDRYPNVPNYKGDYNTQVDEFWAELAYADALAKEQCEIRCKNELFGYHTGGCPLRTKIDERMEYRDQLAIDAANGK